MGSGGIIGGITDAVGLTDSEGNAKASQMARDAQVESTEKNIEFQKWLFEEQKELNMPWYEAGTSAIDRIEQTPDFEFSSEDFENFKDPSYDWRVQQGVDAIDASASSKGNLFSGGQAKRLTEYGQNMASQEYSNAFGRAKSVYDTNLNTDKSLAGVGQNASSAIQQAGSSMGQSVGQSFSDQGNAIAQSYIQEQNANNSSRNALIGAGASFGGMAMMASDVRLKTNINFLFRKDGHNYYSWDWINPKSLFPTIGLLAQEVELYAPQAIMTMYDGFKAINLNVLFKRNLQCQF